MRHSPLLPFGLPRIASIILFIIIISNSAAYSDINKAPNPPAGWLSCNLGYATGPNLGGYRDYINDSYGNLGSSEKISDFGGRAALDLQFKSFFSSHFAYGISMTVGGFITDQVFRYNDNSSIRHQAREEYQLKTADLALDLTFTPVNSRNTNFIPYISAGGMLSSGTLEVFYSNYTDPNLKLIEAFSYRENTFNFGYRFAGGVVVPISARFALNGLTVFSDTKLDFSNNFDSAAEIRLQNRQWFSGIGLTYFYR